MKKKPYLVLIIYSFCANTFALDLFSKPATGSSQNAGTQSSSTTTHKPAVAQKRVGPVVSGMLEDGRDVPERFRGKKTATQLRSEQAEQSSDEPGN